MLINHHEEKFQARKNYANQRETKPKNAATSKYRFRNRSEIKITLSARWKNLHSHRVQVRVPRSTHDGRTSRITRSAEDRSSWVQRNPGLRLSRSTANCFFYINNSHYHRLLQRANIIEASRRWHKIKFLWRNLSDTHGQGIWQVFGQKILKMAMFFAILFSRYFMLFSLNIFSIGLILAL